MQHTTSTASETQSVAKDFAKQFKNSGGVITLSGDLGAGKTTFVQGFAKGLGITEKIISPTFIITRQYPIPNTNRTLYHIDLYRLEDPKELENLGLDEILANPDNLVLIEWPERILKLRNHSIYQVKISTTDQLRRLLQIDKIDI